ncbi:FAD:protein FMN transferase [Microbacterium lushaniae]|uniref:FAD:protein FMN transferase n=1 Tax=Microbacterium lushaniae TaxID=2614639 RepID=A0A5J6L5L8_9MICO|nr:FAD:protein FMN transferase [Microbacterium lushaniae]QEW03671.1 FAD:protein FMN transferase [Microbacterium lushaniae]
MPPAPRAVWAFEAIGTRWSVETAAPLAPAVRSRVEGIVDAFDRTWSRFRPDSLVTGLARSGGAVPLPADAPAMLDVYTALDTATGGAVNPLVGDALVRLGYGAGYPLSSAADPVPAPAGWRRSLTWEGGRLALDAPAMIDVGAVGKGRLVDLVLAAVQESGAADVLVDASGDLAVRGAAHRIGLEHPFDPRRAIGVIEVADAALCASGVTRRAWGDGLHHVLDARTGAPVRAYAATWAVADTALRADALATALFFEGGPELAAAWGGQWVRMRTDGRVEWSPGSTAELFS